MSRFLDWAADGSPVASSLKFAGVISAVGVVACGVIAAPFIYWTHSNNVIYTDLLAEIDQGQSRIFVPGNTCQQQGFPEQQCKTGEAAAFAWSSTWGTSLDYSSFDQCTAKHGNNCHEETIMIPVTTYTYQTTFDTKGNPSTIAIPNTTYYPTTEYEPKVVGWQALADDLTKAAPLYNSPERGLCVRYDGKTFECAQN